MGAKARKQTSKRKTLKQKFKTIKKVADFKRKIKKLARKDPAALHKLVHGKTTKDKTTGVPNNFPDRQKVLAELESSNELVSLNKSAKLRDRKKRADQRKKDLAVAEAARARVTVIEKPDPVNGFASSLSSLSSSFPSSSLSSSSSSSSSSPLSSLLPLNRVSHHWSSIAGVVSTSNLLLLVVDVRDVFGSALSGPLQMLNALVDRIIRKEEKTKNKKQNKKKTTGEQDDKEEEEESTPSKPIIIVLNKIDLVPASVTRLWLSYLSSSCPHPVVAVHCCRDSDFDSKTGIPIKKVGCAGTVALRSLISQYSPSSSSSSGVVVGVVGFGNVGKSSLINTILETKAAATGPNPFYTKSMQRYRVSKGVYILDSPAIPPTPSSPGPVSFLPLASPVITVHALISKFNRRQLQSTLQIPDFTRAKTTTTTNHDDDDDDDDDDANSLSEIEFDSFLSSYIQRSGTKKFAGGQSETASACRQFLRDWNSALIPFYTPAPEHNDDKDNDDDDNSNNSSELPTEWSSVGVARDDDDVDVEAKVSASANDSLIHRLLNAANDSTLLHLRDSASVGVLTKSWAFFERAPESFLRCQPNINRRLNNQIEEIQDHEGEDDDDDDDCDGNDNEQDEDGNDDEDDDSKGVQVEEKQLKRKSS